MVTKTERRETLRKNGDENAAVDTWCLTIKDRKRNENIRQAVGVACITDKTGSKTAIDRHVQRREEKRREDDSSVEKIMKAKWSSELRTSTEEMV